MNTKGNAAPQARFCACQYEGMRAGAKVFVRGDGLLTTNRTEAYVRASFPVGRLVKNGGALTLKLNQRAKDALAA